MRASLPILFLVAFPACCHAQFSADYRESEMYKRWDVSRGKAMAAINANAEGKRTKKDPALESSLAAKSFSGDGAISLKKEASNISPFLYDQKYKGREFTTRSFLGIKNPWFGNKVAETNEASLFSKTALNDDKTFATREEKTRKAMQADKTVKTSNEVVEVRTYEARGGTQGAMDKVSEKVKKDMSIEEIRELLNRN